MDLRPGRPVDWLIRAAVLLVGGVAGLGAAAAAPVDPIDRIAEFTRLDPDYALHRAPLDAKLAVAETAIAAEEHAGRPRLCAAQILREAQWLESSTTDWPRVYERLADFEAALAGPPRSIEEPSPTDGSWGRCYTEWFFKLDASYEQLTVLARTGQVPTVSARFLDRINSPAALLAHLEALLVSDLAATGVDRRRELNETVSDLLRLIRRKRPANYRFHPALQATLERWILERLRTPDTGYFGPIYRLASGPVRVSDLSITFHVASYMEGAVPDWPRIITTTLAIKDLRYPRGWLDRSGYANHHDMDVVQLFRFGWPEVGPEQREAIRVEIRRMLDWCLQRSWQSDGSFAIGPSDETLEGAYYYGTSFLARIGYFDRHRRFWTDEDFPDAAVMAATLRQRMTGLLAAAGPQRGEYYRSALGQLWPPQ